MQRQRVGGEDLLGRVGTHRVKHKPPVGRVPLLEEQVRPAIAARIDGIHQGHAWRYVQMLVVRDREPALLGKTR